MLRSFASSVRPLCAGLAWWALLLSASSTGLLSCVFGGAPQNGEGEREGEGEGEGEGETTFQDHTQANVIDRAAFAQLAAQGPSSAALKVVITGFGLGAERPRFLDSRFYGFHDEYYWFRLLNDAAIDGLTDPQDAPLLTAHGPFATIADIVAWARGEAAAGRPLPLGLQFVDGGLRLYAPRFYDLALFDEPRTLGIATVLRFPAVSDEHPERWALELEFQDQPTEIELRTFLRVVGGALPVDVGEQLYWVTRSAAQEEIAAQLPADLRARTLAFSDLVPEGAREVYSEGLTAGRVLVVRRGEEDKLLAARNTDILVVEDVPSYLPPCAALITAAPQTALAHVNLLARNRGIPNVFIDGAVDDPNLDQLGRVRAPAILSARTPDVVDVHVMNENDFATWRSLSSTTTTTIMPPVDLTDVSATMDVEALSFSDADALRPLLGGKSVGFLALLEAGVVTVDRPLAVTIAPYAEHLATCGLVPRLHAMLTEPTFATSADVRRLVLEGPSGLPANVVAGFRQSHAIGNVLRDLVDDGGVTGIMRTTPIAEATLVAIDDVLQEHFGRYASSQALRFRSSSNVEDAEGMNGAGLYTSNTGFLSPQAGEPSVEDALRETWASYWGVEAFEERRLARVDHLSGSMGVLVHANFPDSLERNNGVALFTILPNQGQGTLAPHGGFLFEVNQQTGSWSVTNPPPGSSHQPEITRIVLGPSDPAPRIERVLASSLVPPGSNVLDDDTLLSMFADARRITETWLARLNEGLPAGKRRSTLTLDFETRMVEDGWPALRSGLLLPSRLVWKQARTLEPSPARVPEAVSLQPFPQDVLARARRVERRTCTGAVLRLSVVEALTDPTLFPEMGFAVEPFTSFLIVEQTASGTGTTTRSAVHTSFLSVNHPQTDLSGWSLDVAIAPERRDALGLSRIVVEQEGHVVVEDEAGVALEDDAVCTRQLLFSSPADFLTALLEENTTSGD
jgi:hypothetical protein